MGNPLRCGVHESSASGATDASTSDEAPVPWALFSTPVCLEMAAYNAVTTQQQGGVMEAIDQEPTVGLESGRRP